MKSNPSSISKRRSILKKIGIGFISIFIVGKTVKGNASHCPGHVDCQGFVPPCKNCKDPNRWKSIAVNKLNFYFQNFWENRKG